MNSRRTRAGTRLAIAAGATLLVVLAACSGDRARADASHADVGGTVVVSSGADADLLVPALTQQLQGAQVVQVMFELLAEPPANLNTFGDEGFTPGLADRWTWADDSLSIAFHISPQARWHDGIPVTAHDVAFTWSLYTNPETGSYVAPLLAGIDSVSVRDSLTAVFWFARRHLEQFYQATYQMRIHPRHLLDSIPVARLKTSTFARQPVGSGPFRFARWVPGSLIEVVADTSHHRGRPPIDRVIWTIAPDPTALTTRFFAGEADFVEPLRPPDMAEFGRNDDVRAVPIPSLMQVFLIFNSGNPRNRAQAHPVLGDREVRRALTMAIDREAIVRNVYDSLGRVGLGPTNRVFVGADTALGHLPHDPARARQLLDSLGWRPRADGIRVRDGRVMRLSLAVPTSSGPRMRMAVLLQEMLRQAGVQVDLEQMEFNRFIEHQNSRRFDMVIAAWMLDPSPTSIRQGWSTQAADAADGANYGNYRSAVFDAHVDSAAAELAPDRARAHLRRAYETLLADAPAVFLAETVNYAGLHRRLETGELRADGWWHTLRDWSIPADQRIPRDASVPTAAAR